MTAAEAVTGGISAQKYRGVLMTVESITVTDIYPALGDTFSSITGIPGFFRAES